MCIRDRLHAGADGPCHRHQSEPAGGRSLRSLQEPADRFGRQLVARGAGGEPHLAGEDVRRAHRLWPVSYTHLDVYKRQATRWC